MNMDNISKFYADAQRIKKHYRAEHSTYDGGEVCRTGGAGATRCGYDNMLAERALKEKTGETSRLKDSYLKQGGII